VPLPPAQLGL